MLRKLIRPLAKKFMGYQVDQKSKKLDDNGQYHKVFRKPLQPDGTDSAYYYKINQAILDLDEARFFILIKNLIESLEARATFFGDEEVFTTPRFEGWCAALKFLSGSFHFANTYFLTRLGSFIDSPETYERICRLTVAGLDETARRWEYEAPDLRTWVHLSASRADKSRLSLANTVNYLLRDAFRFNYTRIFSGLIAPKLRENYDVGLKSMSFSSGIFTDRMDPLYLTVHAPLSELNAYLLGEVEPNATELIFSFEESTVVMRRLIGLALQCNRNLSDIAAVDALIDAYRLANEDKIDKPIFSSVLPSLAGRKKYAPLLNLIADKSDKISFGHTFQVHATLRARGDFSINELPHLTSEVIAQLDLGQINQVVSVTRMCTDVVQQRRITTELKTRMAHIAINPTVNNNVNFIARCTELEQLDGDVRVAEDHHAAVDHLIKKGLLVAPKNEPILKDNEKVVLFCFDQDRVLPNLITGMLPTLQQEGYAFFNLAADCFDSAITRPWTLSPRLSSDLRQIESVATETNELLNTWCITPEERVVSCNGINIYQGLYERVSRVQKRFTVDWDAPSSVQFKDIWIRQVDRLVYALDRVREVCEPRGIKVKLTSLQSHFAPFCMLRSYADTFPNTFEHLTFNSSYENWKSNMAGDQLSTLTLMNNTRYPAPSNPAFGLEQDFNKWFEDVYLPNKDALWVEHGQLASLNRAGDMTPESQMKLEAIAKRAKSADQVFCALGKIPYDLAVPYQGGPGHTDMKDWINHTVDSVSGSNNLLLIKPHPHELNYQISGKPNEGFLDLIVNKDSENLIILPHRGISLPHLDNIVDHFTCWNGSSIAEIGANGKSIMAADDWARKNYPIDVFTPVSRDETRAILRGDVPLVMHHDFEEKSRAYVIYLTMAPFALPYPFINRSATNKDFNRAWINWDHFKNSQSFADLDHSRSMIREHI